MLNEFQQQRRMRRERSAMLVEAARVLGHLHAPPNPLAGENPAVGEVVGEGNERPCDDGIRIMSDSSPGLSHVQAQVAELDGNQEWSSPASQLEANSRSVNLSFIDGDRVVVASASELASNFVIVDASPVQPSRFEAFFLNRPVFRWVIRQFDWWLRWMYQLVIALIFSLNPGWKPLTAFVSELPLFPALSFAQHVNFLSTQDVLGSRRDCPGSAVVEGAEKELSASDSTGSSAHRAQGEDPAEPIPSREQGDCGACSGTRLPEE